MYFIIYTVKDSNVEKLIDIVLTPLSCEIKIGF